MMKELIFQLVVQIPKYRMILISIYMLTLLMMDQIPQELMLHNVEETQMVDLYSEE